jgi:pimeloyl-ACP methyl ester carboxylesterase
MSRYERVEFFSGPSHRLKAIFCSPNDRPGPFSAVILCNGYMGLKEIYMPQVAAALAEAGIASLAFDYRGFGESEGPRYRLLPMEQIEDIHNAISYIGSRLDVDNTRIGIWGTSLGASHAICASATDRRVICVVANMPGVLFADYVYRRPADQLAKFIKDVEADRKVRVLTGVSRRVSPIEILLYDDDSRRAYEASLAKYPSRREMQFPLETADRLAEYRPDRFIDLIAPRPLLVFSAEHDELTPMIDQKRMFERAGDPKRLEIIKGATHYSAYTSPFFERAIALSVDFYREAMK